MFFSVYDFVFYLTYFFSALEEKLSVVLDQLDIAQKQLAETEERATKSETEGKHDHHSCGSLSIFKKFDGVHNKRGGVFM